VKYYPRKYIDPVSVVTVSNCLRFPSLIRLVVIKYPSLILGLPNMYPVIVPSSLKTYPVSVGVPVGGALSGEGGANG